MSWTAIARKCHQPILSHQRRASLMMLFAATLFPLASCTDPTSGSSQPEATDKLQVVTTFLPITDFTLAVAGDHAEVTQLLPPNVGPHDYQAKPQDAQSLAEADVLIENGLGIEEFLTGLIDNAGNSDLVLVDSSEGVATIPTMDDAHSEEEDHEESEHHSHGAFDPHIWLDPKKAMQQVGNIRDALIAADPAGEKIYTANADAYLQELQQLDEKISAALAPYAGQTFVSYHDFAEHFARSYGLDVEHLVNVPEESATPADMQRVIKAVESSNSKTLLQEPVQSGSLSSLAKEMNAQVSEFNPMESSGPEGLSPDYYITTMEKNSQNLAAAFAQSAR